MRSRHCALLVTILFAAGCGDGDSAEAPLPDGAFELRDVGFATPESVLHDSVADVYLVANIHGGGRDRDDNGFISRVSPDGEVLELKWIDGAHEQVRLSAPKGMAVIGDRLFIADIDSVRIFDRRSGAPLGAWSFDGASSLNDLSAARDGSLYVSDMGPGPDASGFGGIVRFDTAGVPTVVVTDDVIDGTNGVVATDDGLVTVTYRGTRIARIDPSGAVTDIARLPAEKNDGVIALPDGSYLVSSWESAALLRVGADGTVSAAIEPLTTPADIGHDARRNRVLIPSFQGHTLRVQPLP